MKRFATAVMTAAICAAVIGVVAADAHDRCTPETTFKYCNEHVHEDRLPLRFKVNNVGKPSSVSSSGVLAAAAAAANEWSRHWPVASVSGSSPNSIKVDLYVGPCAVMCYDGTTTAGFGSDGQNTIVWGDPALCGGHGEGVAVACLWYEGSSGAARHRIKEVDIILNPTKTWKITDAALELVLGELRGSSLAPADWYDVQSALTHEMGHALGLEDIGDPTRPWPANLTDLPKHHQTMYRWYFKGSTNKRTLADGDILALQLAAMATSSDR